jgi:hypothetical protein
MERLGVPTVTVVSTAFELLARAEADAFGLSGMHILVVPHPVGSRPDDVLREWGRGLIADSVAGLTGGAVS